MVTIMIDRKVVGQQSAVDSVEVLREIIQLQRQLLLTKLLVLAEIKPQAVDTTIQLNLIMISQQLLPLLEVLVAIQAAHKVS